MIYNAKETMFLCSIDELLGDFVDPSVEVAQRDGWYRAIDIFGGCHDEAYKSGVAGY